MSGDFLVYSTVSRVWCSCLYCTIVLLVCRLFLFFFYYYFFFFLFCSFFLMIRRPPRSTLDRSSAASDVYKRQDRRRGFVCRLSREQERVFCKRRHVRTDGAVTCNAGRRFRRLRTKSVSYTHLRAHETVLDLVCRLLLEKKKHKKKQKNK